MNMSIGDSTPVKRAKEYLLELQEEWAWRNKTAQVPIDEDATQLIRMKRVKEIHDQARWENFLRGHHYSQNDLEYRLEVDTELRGASSEEKREEVIRRHHLREIWAIHAENSTDQKASELRERHGLSKYSDPQIFLRMQQLRDEVLDAETRSKLNFGRELVVGTAQTGSVNGRFFPGYEGRADLIVLDEGVFAIAAAIAPILVNLLEEEWRALGLSFGRPKKPFLNLPISEIGKAYVMDGVPKLAYPIDVPKDLVNVASQLQTGMEMFLMCHEISHLILRHHETENHGREMLKSLELEADRRGFRLTLESHQKLFGNPLLIQPAVEVLFQTCECLEKIFGLYDKDVERRRIEAMENYPSFQERCHAVREEARSLLLKAKFEISCEIADSLKSEIEGLFKQSYVLREAVARTVIAEGHEIHVHPKWRLD